MKLRLKTLLTYSVFFIPKYTFLPITDVMSNTLELFTATYSTHETGSRDMDFYDGILEDIG
jgi:hypothetical protein